MVSIPHQGQVMDITYGCRGAPGGGSGRGKTRTSAEGSPLSPVSWEASMMQLAKELRVICRSPDQGPGFPRTSLSSPSPSTSPFPSPSPSPPTPGPFSAGPFSGPLSPFPEVHARPMPIQHQTSQERLREKLSQICRSPRQTQPKLSHSLNVVRPSKRKLSGFRNLFRACVSIGPLHVEDLQVTIEGRKLWVNKVVKETDSAQIGYKNGRITGLILEENDNSDNNGDATSTTDVINANDPNGTENKENTCNPTISKENTDAVPEDSGPIVNSLNSISASDKSDTVNPTSSHPSKNNMSKCEVTITHVQDEQKPRLQVPCCVDLPEDVEPERLLCVVRDGVLEIKEGRRRSMPSPAQVTHSPPSPRALDPSLLRTHRPMVIEDDGSEKLKLVLRVPPGYCFEDLQIKMVDDHLIVASKPKHGILCRSISLGNDRAGDNQAQGRPGFAQVFEMPDSVDPYSLTAHLTESNQLIIQATLSQRGRCFTF